MGAVIAAGVIVLILVAGTLALVAGLAMIAEGRRLKVPPVIRSCIIALCVLVIVAVCIGIAAAMGSFLELV